MKDAVDRLLAQWGEQRPDVDVSPMGVVGRISRTSALLDKSIAQALAAHGLQPGEFDVLATLRRSGQPFRMTVAELLGGAMVTSGAITNRLNRLTAKGLIEREIDPLDRRSVIVTLTPEGKLALDGALGDHVENERFLLAALDPSEQEQLARLLRQLLIGLGDNWKDASPEPLTAASDASTSPA